MGFARLLGGLVGIVALLAFLSLVIWSVMWLVLLASRYLPMIGKRHQHPTWKQQQQEGDKSLSKNRAP